MVSFRLNLLTLRTHTGKMVENEKATESNWQQSDGHHDSEQNIVSLYKGPLKRSAFRAVVQDFSPIWYVASRVLVLEICQFLTNIKVHMVHECRCYWNFTPSVAISVPRASSALDYCVHS
jgi:hypothetical protein